jgi:multidrug resistance efflux pump
MALLGLSVALCGGCSAPQVTASEDSMPGEELVTRRAVFQELLLLTGELEAVRSEKIHVPRTPVWQLPIRWMEQDGARVSEGQKILELDNTQFTGELEQTRLARSGAYNEMIRKRADVGGELSEKEFVLERRRIELEKARVEAAVPASLLPEREYQELQLALARAEFEHENAAEDLETTRIASNAEIEELRIALERADDEIAVAERAIQQLSLEAPRDGILVVAQNRQAGRKFQVGDNVWVGLAVMSIPDLSSMKVVAQLSDVDDGRMAVGDRARCTLDAYPELSFPGRVSEVAPIAQEDDNESLRRSFRVEVHLDESDPEHMRPGMSVKVEVRPEPITNALVIPRVALDLTVSPPRALLADGSTAEVRLGPCTALACVVDEGLTAGTRLRRAG